MRRAIWVLLFLLGCSGPAFEQASPAGGELAGSPSVAGSLAAGGSALLSGAAGNAAGNSAGGVAGSEAGAGGVAGNEAGNSAGGEGGSEEPPPVVAGAAGDAPSHPCDTSTWTAQAFASRELATSPAAALDGLPATRWTSGTERQTGQWFSLKLGAGVVLAELKLSTPASVADVPSSLELELDGKRTPATFVADEPGVLRVQFAATPASSARLVLTAAALQWWSIGEIQAVCK
jgi:hypothetical protein